MAPLSSPTLKWEAAGMQRMRTCLLWLGGGVGVWLASKKLWQRNKGLVLSEDLLLLLLQSPVGVLPWAAMEWEQDQAPPSQQLLAANCKRTRLKTHRWFLAHQSN